MARWSKKLIREQMSWSNKCFRNALIEVYSDELTDEEKSLDLLDLKVILRHKKKENHSQPINEVYLRNLCDLRTNQIELIIEAFMKGKQYRSASTIDVLMSELLERSANPESRKLHETK